MIEDIEVQKLKLEETRLKCSAELKKYEAQIRLVEIQANKPQTKADSKESFCIG